MDPRIAAAPLKSHEDSGIDRRNTPYRHYWDMRRLSHTE